MTTTELAHLAQLNAEAADHLRRFTPAVARILADAARAAAAAATVQAQAEAANAQADQAA